MQPWKTLERQTVLDRGRFLKVEIHRVQLPDGRIIPDWPWLITPDFVNVVPVTPEGLILCFRQTKYGVDGTSLAPVGGFIDPGESPLDAARRELREETGCEASEWIGLGTYRVDPNRGAGMAHLFLARGVRHVAAPSGGDLEEQELLHLTAAETRGALEVGQFKVLAWAAAIEFALRLIET